MAQIIPLYYSNDIAGFQKLQEEELEKAKSSTNPLYFELNWILLQGLICQRDASFTMKQRDLDKVADYLFQTEEWTMYELILFGNLYSFYEVDYVTRLGSNSEPESRPVCDGDQFLGRNLHAPSLLYQAE